MAEQTGAGGVPLQRLRCTYGRGRRVRLRRDTTELFQRGQRCFDFPYRGVANAYRSTSGAAGGCRLLAVAPKRVCKLAVDRNAQKRRMRELFRVESAELHAACLARGVRVDVAVVLVSSEEVPWQRARRAMRKILRHAEQAARRIA